MNEQYQIGDLRLCKSCNKAIVFASAYWSHVQRVGGEEPRHVALPWEEENEKPSVEIKTGYVNFDANDFYALQDKLTAAHTRIAETEQVMQELAADLAVAQINAEQRIADLEAQLAAWYKWANAQEKREN